jgi:ABC-2 type transport system permease protein
MLRKVLGIAGRELTGFFASPAAFLFLTVFLGVTLFVFFWASAFFARNLADVRPLFQWMPVLLIFLVAALTMRSWAEERRSGTVELLLTSPTAPVELVLGKFIGCLVLVLIALLLTLPLPATVATLGSLDWGPVIGGYVASIALAAAYVAIGLWVSCRTDNQIVSLILTVVIAGALYLVGSDTLVSALGTNRGQWLRALGAGSRFVSITRGVFDLRDIYYYLALTVTFLALNRLSLERLRWAGNPSSAIHRRWYWVVGLLAANALGANLWLDQIKGARLDLTQGHLYTLSDATRNYLAQVREPLVIRGYFSAATHPLLAPLVPELRDLLQEYAVAGGGKVRVEFVDPHDDPKIEAEAGSRYGIRPVPFQVSGKYQASVVNSYFEVLVAYGDQYQVLNFRDLIDVKQNSESELDVELKNPEYAITSALRKVLLSYQGSGDVFDTLRRPVTFTGYLSGAENLPKPLQNARTALEAALQQIQQGAGGQFKVVMQDPDGNNALQSRLSHDYGFRPMVMSLLDNRPFWFYMTLGDERQTEPIPLPAALDEAGLKSAVEAAVKRFSPGFLKTVAVLTPQREAQESPFGGGSAQSFNTVRDMLSQSERLIDADLKTGQVPADADLLMVLDPEALDVRQVFGIDQFLMQGGTLLVATSPTKVSIDQSIVGVPVHSGLEEWLSGLGLSLGNGLVLDSQSGDLPIPVQRQVGGFDLNEIELAKYPFIVDVRNRGLDSKSLITSALGSIDVPWATPVNVDPVHNQQRTVTTLLRSSNDSWITQSRDLMPDYDRYPDDGFAHAKSAGPQSLAVMVEGEFDSFFKGKNSPLLSNNDAASGGHPAAAAGTDTTNAADKPSFGSVIEHSPSSSRLIVIGSNALFSDAAIALISQAQGTRNLKAAEFAQNIIDWSLEDQGLLSIRSREHFARTLTPLTRDRQEFLEYLNYGAALGGLGLVWIANKRRRHRGVVRRQRMLEGI